jgi:Family of unknown function (DUF5641)
MLSRSKTGELSSSIEWKFIPAYSPHLGGLWESNIKTMKRLMVEHYPPTKLDFIGWHTVLCEVERIMNSRPLCWNPIDLMGEEPLTPFHFLTQRIVTDVPLEINQNKLLTNHWKEVKQYTDVLWDRWSEEYLKSLAIVQQPNPKGNKITVGDVVLVKEGAHPRQAWPLAKVEEVLGDTEETRLVRVEYANGTTEIKSCAHIIKLPISTVDANASPGEDEETPNNKTTESILKVDKAFSGVNVNNGECLEKPLEMTQCRNASIYNGERTPMNE